jgi:hypothetical protein
LLASLAGFPGCASMNQQAADSLSQAPAIGLPANAPARPAEPLPFPAVHDMPPPRSNSMLTEVEQQKMEDDLVAARTRQQAIAGTKLKAKAASKGKVAPPKQPPQARANAPPPPRITPASASGAIY